MPKKINVKGAIISNNDQWIYDWLDMDATSPKSVSQQLPNTNEPIEVSINSGGGSVFAGSEIYTTLKDYPGHVTVKIVGLAASAASVIAMAGDKVMMSPTAQLMIHNASSRADGDYRDMDQTSTILKNTNRSIANAYKLKSGKNFEELLSMMDVETWLTAEQAVEHGLVDEVMFQTPDLVAGMESELLPTAILDKIRSMKNDIVQPSSENVIELSNTISVQNFDKAKAELQLLKLKGAY